MHEARQRAVLRSATLNRAQRPLERDRAVTNPNFPLYPPPPSVQSPAPEQPPQPQNAKTKQRIPLWVAIVAGLALSLVSCSAGVALKGGIASVTGAAPSATVTAPAPTVTETAEAEK